MDAENLMKAVMQSFRDANLRVDLLPMQDARVHRVSTASGMPQPQTNTGTQAVDGRYASVYKVHHCKVIPTSPPQMITEFPPQRAELSPGCDNFQVGGTGSGETPGLPSKAACYRGGLNWTSRGEVYAPRVSHYTDPFASSLRKYPSLSPERSAELVERLISYAPTRNRSPPSRHSPSRQECAGISYRSGKAYEESYAARCRPRAPEECPTRDRKDEFRKQTGHNDIRFIRDVSRRLRESLKSISSYTHTQTTTACTDDRDSRECFDSPIPETSNTELEQQEPISAPEFHTYPVNSTVQAVASTTSREVETVPLPTPTLRNIAIPPSPIPSYPRISVHPQDLPDLLITKSVQTCHLSGKSVETTTSSIELAKHDLVKVISKKSKSLSDFRLNWDVRTKILAWLDDTSDPKIKEIQEMVVKNLAYRLKGMPVTECDMINVKLGNCLKYRRTESKDRCYDFTKKHGHSNIHKHDVYRPEINSRPANDQSDFEEVIKEWLNNISIKKRDIFLRPVKKEQIYNTFVNRLKHLVVKQSTYGRKQSLRAEIMEILDEIPIEVNSCDKTEYLGRLTDALMCRLENLPEERYTETKTCRSDVPGKLNHFQPTEKETREFVVQKVMDVFRKQNMVNPDLVNKTIINLVDLVMDSVNSNEGIEEISSLLQNDCKLPENEAFECATQMIEHCREIINEKYTNFARAHQAVFMIKNVPGNYLPKTSGTCMSQHSIGSIVDKDIEENFNQYKMQLAKQIDLWLSGLAILQGHDKDFRQAVVLDLASEIVDRQKYLEFNKNRGADIDELEHLKYQIFKWIKRLLGDENMETVDHAAELMEMMRNIPVPMLTRSQDRLERGFVGNENVHRSKSNFGIMVSRKESQNSSMFTNFVIRNVSTNKLSDSKKGRQRSKTSSPHNRNNDTSNQSHTHNNSDSRKGHSTNQKTSFESKQKHPNGHTASSRVEPNPMQNNTTNHNNQPDYTSRIEQINQDPGPFNLPPISPPTPSISKTSAAAKLMADWRPPPVFTPPPSGRPLVKQVYDEFQEYLKNWSQQIPIPANTPEEEKIAEKARLGILNGVWKVITKIKTQPAVYQNKFYYEDVLGKEIDGLLDCLPQTQELKEKRYTLKVLLLEKTSNMNELIKDLEMPDNYKEIIDQKTKEKNDEKVRKVVKLDLDNPSYIFEQMLVYCILDDFLSEHNYKENDKIKANAYRLKLLKQIQEYLDSLKLIHGREIEDLFRALLESDIMEVLKKVPLPTNESVKEDEDEILLGLEIEQWMMNLPIVKNDDPTEQRQRRRLMDALTKKLHEMEKVNIAPCCGETEVRKEISYFLDKVPLEKDQDLKINEMVEELTRRLKRQGARKKSVAFQDGHQQRAFSSSRLLNRSQLANVADRLYTTDDEWDLDEDEVRAHFRNNPLCSTRIDQLSNEWAVEEGQDPAYRQLFKERPACSTMIEPQGFEQDEIASRQPDFGHPYEQEPYYVYAPGQFYESGRGGSFGYSLRGALPQTDERYRYPDLNDSPVMPRQSPPLQRYYDNEGDIIPDNPLADSQYRPVKEPRGYQVDKYMSSVDARRAVPSRQAALPQEWEGQSEVSGGFVSMMDHVPPRPIRASSPHRSQIQEAASPAGYNLSGPPGFVSLGSNPPEMYVSEQRSAYGRPKTFTSHRSQVDPKMVQERSLIEPNAPEALPDSSRDSRRTANAFRPNMVETDPNIMQQEPREVNPQISRGRKSHRSQIQEQDAAVQSGFVSMISHQLPPPPIRLESSPRRETFNQSLRIRNEDSQSHPEPSERAPDPQPQFRRSTDPEGIRDIINHNRSAHRSPQNTQSSPYEAGPNAQNRSVRNISTRQPVSTDRLNTETANIAPAASAPRSGLLASNAPSDISNRPYAFSTPNQRSDIRPPGPPNLRERRQIERERAPARRLDMDTGEVLDTRGEDRCHCMERFKRWNKRSPSCNTCDDCVHGGGPPFYHYPYPFPYMYPPPYVRPPYPPYCRR